MKKEMLKIDKRPILFVKVVLYLITIATLLVCFILLPELAREEATGKPNPEMIYIFLATIYIIAIPFFIALYQTFKLVHQIEKNIVFSMTSLKILQNIKNCAIVFSILITLVTIIIVSILRTFHPEEDAQPFIMLGIIFTFIPIVIVIFVAVLQKLLTEAINLKSENDLIV